MGELKGGEETSPYQLGNNDKRKRYKRTRNKKYAKYELNFHD